ncbi:MAG TPA: hypothetical protein DIT64_13925 [Verrucomicrobiales bacterium]|nr:hypothetical protein [Verrucomicrobiales bacterium]
MLKKNWYLLLPLLLVALPGLLFGYYTLSYGYGPKDAWNATRYFLQSGTRYTQKYEEYNFSRLRNGTDGRGVYQIMKMQPFERHDNDSRWIYSLPKPGSTAYHERVVLLQRDKDNVPRVKGLVRGFKIP